MADGGLFVYGYSRDAHEQITRLSDFISPTVVAMWNLRWQVQGFVSVYPQASQSEIVQRFALGSKIRGNEIRRACIENTWEDQEFRFASILLTNTIAIFEEFVERLVGIALSGDNKRKAYKALQYPNSANGRGYQQAYSALGSPAPELDGVFNSTPILGRWYSGSCIQSLLLCYRFFKETRNAIAHNGGRATPDLVEAYNQFQPIATQTNLGVKEVPVYSIPVLNGKVDIDLRGINAFSNVVLRIIATYDIDLSNRAGAKIDIDKRLGSIKAAARSHVNADKKKKRINGLLLNANLPPSVHTQPFLDFLRSTDRIPSYW